MLDGDNFAAFALLSCLGKETVAVFCSKAYHFDIILFVAVVMIITRREFEVCYRISVEKADKELFQLKCALSLSSPCPPSLLLSSSFTLQLSSPTPRVGL